MLCHYQSLRRRLNYLEHLTEAHKRRKENRQQVIQQMALEASSEQKFQNFTYVDQTPESFIYISEFKNLKSVQDGLVDFNYLLL